MRPDFFKTILKENLDRIEKFKGLVEKRPEEAETVRKLRVATRRLREALKFIETSEAGIKVRKLKKKARKLGKGLGLLRDLDVSANILKKEFRRSHARAVRNALERLHRERRERWKAVQPEIRDFKAGKYGRNLLDSLGGSGGLSKNKLVRARSKIIESRRKELRDVLRAPGVLSNRNMHRLRIGIKKLRYDFEILSAAGDPEAAKKIASLKRRQILLGRWHDYEILRTHLDQWGTDVRLRREVRELEKKAAADVVRAARKESL